MIGDFLKSDDSVAIVYTFEVSFGYFVIDNLEGLVGLGITKLLVLDREDGFNIKAGAAFRIFLS